MPATTKKTAPTSSPSSTSAGSSLGRVVDSTRRDLRASLKDWTAVFARRAAFGQGTEQVRRAVLRCTRAVDHASAAAGAGAHRRGAEGAPPASSARAQRACRRDRLSGKRRRGRFLRGRLPATSRGGSNRLHGGPARHFRVRRIERSSSCWKRSPVDSSAASSRCRCARTPYGRVSAPNAARATDAHLATPNGSMRRTR